MTNICYGGIIQVFLLIDIKTPPFFDTSFFGFFIKTIIPLLKQAGNGLLFCFI
nr:MAG TPA: hypothetical protein [Caudoviricetes sp.]